MPKDHARKNQLAALKATYKLKHSDAIALLDHPDAGEHQLLCEILEGYEDITTYQGAVDLLDVRRSGLSGSGVPDPDDYRDDYDDDPDACDQCLYGSNRHHCCACGASIDYECVCFEAAAMTPAIAGPTTTAALDLVARGLAVFALPPGGRRPQAVG
jgi:hypothetical protein